MNCLFGCSKLQPAELWDREMTLWYFLKYPSIKGFPDGANGKESTCQCRRIKRQGFDPWVGKIPREGNGNPLVFLPVKFQGQRSLVGYTPLCSKKLGVTEHTQSISFCSLFSGHRRSRIALLPLFEKNPIQCSLVQLLSHVWLFVTTWTAAHRASLSIANSRSLLQLMSIESVISTWPTPHPWRNTVISSWEEVLYQQTLG